MSRFSNSTVTHLAGANAVDAQAVTPNNNANLTRGATKGLYVGGSGDVVVVMAGGSEVKFTGLAAGIVHPLSVVRVKATGTTAVGIVAVY
ncbi:hypothetical protein JNUCC32_31035 (plasmid) [Paenibacillus sp. JNUCC32]|uniref:spike base protein, RCAP_Rcc01079 family n=1 Tax=Paenibacillus sp. JNUCC32 TaxID=2777984 RepID=UPI001787DB3B|nr:hypothetical protein [Paenibacillus sp. JNUCC-32]QOT13723.1 hypothetical protein JNUCC32_31035 [Paenibacillus sp. JNUCC-32]